MYIYIYIYIYVCAVELKTGPIFALYKLKTGPFFVFGFFMSENIILPAEKKEDFWKTSKNNQKHFYKLRIGPIMLRNILGGTVFNLYLDQLST